jgi:hypothetical protein
MIGSGSPIQLGPRVTPSGKFFKIVSTDLSSTTILPANKIGNAVGIFGFRISDIQDLPFQPGLNAAPGYSRDYAANNGSL